MKVQNWLINLWIRVEGLSEKRGSRAISLLNESATKIDAVLNGIFGAGLFSYRFIITSSILSIASLYLTTALRFGLSREVFAMAKYIGGFLLCLLLANALIARPRKALMLATAVSAILCLYLTEGGQTASARNAFSGVFVGVLFDWGFVCSGRLILRKLAVGRTILQTVIPGILMTVLGFILLSPASMFVSTRLWCGLQTRLNCPWFPVARAEWIIAIASATNLAAGLCALSLLIVVVAALFHKLFWPFVSRLVHVCYERRIIERRRLFFTAGAALFTYAFHWFSWLSRIPKFLSF